jgi:hypothetical protein
MIGKQGGDSAITWKDPIDSPSLIQANSDVAASVNEWLGFSCDIPPDRELTLRYRCQNGQNLLHAVVGL